MGMYDEMVLDCPCGGVAIKQFKDLHCDLVSYDLSNGEMFEGYTDGEVGPVPLGPVPLENAPLNDLIILLAAKYDKRFTFYHDFPLDGVDNFRCRDCEEIITPEPHAALKYIILSFLLEGRTPCLRG